MGLLYDKQQLDEQLETLPKWQQEAFQSFSSMITDTNTYPCVPARQGFLANHLRFLFAGDPNKESTVKQLADALREYSDCSRNAGNYTSLAVFFQTSKEIRNRYAEADYRELFWSILNHVTAFDEAAWPKDIPTDPAHHKWEFCFHGEPYFAFCATPAHHQRKSRHFPFFLMAFQPRWVFAEMNESTAFGRKMKSIIRKRLTDYDGIPGHPDLKWYGQEDNHEWKQYFLNDDDTSPNNCPFQRMKSKLTTFF